MASKSAGTKTVAIKAKAAPQKDKDNEGPEKETSETPDAPLPN